MKGSKYKTVANEKGKKRLLNEAADGTLDPFLITSNEDDEEPVDDDREDEEYGLTEDPKGYLIREEDQHGPNSGVEDEEANAYHKVD